MDITYNKHDIAVYGGYITNDEKLIKSTSGGIATALAEHIISSGGYVAGVTYSDDFYKAEYIVTNCEQDLEKLKGSKYIEVDINDVYNKIMLLLKKGKQVLFVGLPCVVAALYSFLGNRYDNLYTCELICHGPTSQKVHKEYVTYLEKKFKSKIVDFSVRRKEEQWIPSYLYARFKNGKEFKKPFYDTEYGYAFSVLGREPCYDCKFKGNNRCGDIMIGDFWGVNESDLFWNVKGVSVIFAETEKGNDLLKKLKNVKLIPTTFERAVEKNLMVIKPKTKAANYDKFIKYYRIKGLMYATKKTKGIKGYMICLARKIIPQKLKPIIKIALFNKNT